jgi:hypothetical protein
VGQALYIQTSKCSHHGVHSRAPRIYAVLAAAWWLLTGSRRASSLVLMPKAVPLVLHGPAAGACMMSCQVRGAVGRVESTAVICSAIVAAGFCPPPTTSAHARSCSRRWWLRQRRRVSAAPMRPRRRAALGGSRVSASRLPLVSAVNSPLRPSEVDAPGVLTLLRTDARSRVPPGALGVQYSGGAAGSSAAASARSARAAPH